MAGVPAIPVFGSRSVNSVVEEAVPRALDSEPLTLSKAVKAVKVRYVSEERAKKV